MRILITGAGGNVGTGMTERLASAGHDLVLVDLERPSAAERFHFVQCDLQAGFGLESAMQGCDLVLHTAAWHGIHHTRKTEIDYWRLNVDGTFWVLQAARAAGVDRFLFLSSLAWHDRYGTYGFTKVVGEELCEYHRRRRGLRYVAVRPGDFTPWADDFIRYGQRLLYGGVDREDVLDCVTLAVDRLAVEPAAGEGPEQIVVNAVRANAFEAGELVDWERDPLDACERVFPGSSELVQRYSIDVTRTPVVVEAGDGARELGYAPRRHFGTFLEELRALDAAGGEPAVRARQCPY